MSSWYLLKHVLPFFDQAVNYEVTPESCLDTILPSLQNLCTENSMVISEYTDTCLEGFYSASSSQNKY